MRSLYLLIIALLLPISASAQSLADPNSPDPEVARWLAVAFVAEAGWADPQHVKAKKDHRAIFHVLKNRWPRLKRRWPKLYPRFVDVVQMYVAAFDPRTKRGKRVRWLIGLLTHEDLNVAPPSWPDKASWHVHRPWWEAALKRAQGCLAGRRCPDPYKGLALHWGGSVDKPQGRMIALPDAGTYNTFYRIGPRKNDEAKKETRKAALP